MLPAFDGLGETLRHKGRIESERIRARAPRVRASVDGRASHGGSAERSPPLL